MIIGRVASEWKASPYGSINWVMWVDHDHEWVPKRYRWETDCKLKIGDWVVIEGVRSLVEVMERYRQDIYRYRLRPATVTDVLLHLVESEMDSVELDKPILAEHRAIRWIKRLLRLFGRRL